MIRISKLADYGTLVMVELARVYPEQLSARDLARLTHVSMPTVSKLLKRLTLASLLISVRGVLGGYLLACAPNEISVAEVIYAVDEVRGLTECSVVPETCVLHGVCNTQGHWRLINKIIDKALRDVSLLDFVNNSKGIVFNESI